MVTNSDVGKKERQIWENQKRSLTFMNKQRMVSLEGCQGLSPGHLVIEIRFQGLCSLPVVVPCTRA